MDLYRVIDKWSINKYTIEWRLFIMGLDLHGLSYEKAEQQVMDLVEKYYGKNIMLRVVTGNSGKMKEVVRRVVDMYRLDSPIELSNTEVVIYT